MFDLFSISQSTNMKFVVSFARLLCIIQPSPNVLSYEYKKAFLTSLNFFVVDGLNFTSQFISEKPLKNLFNIHDRSNFNKG